MATDLRHLIRELARMGLDVRPARSGHLKVYRGKRLISTIPKTPSDYRALQNARHDIARRLK